MGRPASFGPGHGRAGGVPAAAAQGMPYGRTAQGYPSQAAYGAPGVQGQMPYGAPGGWEARPAYPAPRAYVPPPTSVPPQEPKRKKRGWGFWAAMAVALVAIVVAVLLALTLCTDGKKSRSGDLGQLEGKSEAEIQAELDRVVAEGMFNVSIASVVELADGTSEGELRIENVPNNNYLMQVVITREDTGQELYRTDVIEPNHHIQSDTLDVDLDPGSYDCLATFTALDPETEDEVGEVAAAMKINVLG